MKYRLALVLSAGLAAAVLTAAGAADWPQWRGPNRDGLSEEVPTQLPAKKLLWKQPLAGETHAGIATAEGLVVVHDHGGGKDYVRCFRAEDGKALWTHVTANKVEMDFGAGPRATPLLYEGTAITLSAVGDLLCLDLAGGKPVWRLNLAKQFGAKVPQWGYCSSPLVVDGNLIVNPGAPGVSLAALDPKTGKPIWKAPGKPAAYAGLIAGTFGGVPQVVGYDEETLGGWDVATGKRVWTLKLENTNDYNVGTPVNVDGRILVSTDANYTRLHTFAAGGKIVAKPLATSEELAPDMATPVALDGLVFGPTYGLTCLDATAGLKMLWKHDGEDALTAFATLIAGNGRVMVFTESGTLFLVEAERKECRILGRMDLCQKTWSHPALANGRLFIRDAKTLYCYAMGDA